MVQGVTKVGATPLHSSPPSSSPLLRISIPCLLNEQGKGLENPHTSCVLNPKSSGPVVKAVITSYSH